MRRAALALVAVLAGCFGARQDDLLVTIGEIRITVKDFQGRMKEYEFDPSMMPQDENEAFKQRVLNEIIEERVLLQEAENRKIDVSTDELERAVDQIRADYPGDGFEKVLDAQGITLRELRERTRRNLILRRIADVATKDVRRPAKDKVEAYYKEHIEDYFEPAKYDVRQIVIAKREDAVRVVEQAKKGQPFDALARAASIAPEGAQGGDLGWVSGGLPDPVWAEVKKAPVGKIVGPVASDYGFHVVLVRGKKPERLIPVAEAAPAIAETITETDREDALMKWKQQVFSKVKVVRNNALLAAL